MTILTRLTAAARTLLAGPRAVPSNSPEVWCRPATVLALRDRQRAGACVAGWRGNRPR